MIGADVCHGAKVPQLDLNLIRVFLAVYETSSVSRAAERIHVAQPTVSYALAKLRTVFRDPLFVRTRDGMQPTALARAVHGELAGAVDRIEQVLAHSGTFDPATSSRTFTIAMSDIGEMVLLPNILDRLRCQAPAIELKVVQPPVDRLQHGLTTGEISAAVGHFPVLTRQMRTTRLFDEHYVCLLRRDHRLAAGDLTVESFTAARHVDVSSEATGHDMVRHALEASGVRRHIVLSIAHFAILSHVIANSELLAVVPSRLAALFARYEAVTALPLPFAMPTFAVQVYSPAHGEPAFASKWLRSLIVDALADET